MGKARYKLTYNQLDRRRASWRAELRKEKSKYPKKLIRSTINAITADMAEFLKARLP